MNHNNADIPRLSPLLLASSNIEFFSKPADRLATDEDDLLRAHSALQCFSPWDARGEKTGSTSGEEAVSLGTLAGLTGTPGSASPASRFLAYRIGVDLGKEDVTSEISLALRFHHADGPIQATGALTQSWAFAVQNASRSAWFFAIIAETAQSAQYMPTPAGLQYDATNPKDIAWTISGLPSAGKLSIHCVTNGSRYWDRVMDILERNAHGDDIEAVHNRRSNRRGGGRRD